MRAQIADGTLPPEARAPSPPGPGGRVDLGFRGVDADNLGKQIIHRGRFQSFNPQQRRGLRRCQAVEPAIGHLKADHQLDRCWLQGALGDALHAISCAAGYNLRRLLRAIARLGIGPAFFVPGSNGAVISFGPTGLTVGA